MPPAPWHERSPARCFRRPSQRTRDRSCQGGPPLAEAAPHLGEDDIVADLTLARPAVFVVAGAHVLYTDEDPLLRDREGRLAALTAIAT